MLVDEPVAGDVADADVDDRRDRDDAEQHERRDLLAPRPADARAPGASTPCTARTSPRRAGRAARRTGGSRGRRRRRGRRLDDAHDGLPARRRNTSSSEVSRVDSRYSGSPSSAMTSRSMSMLVVAVDRHLDEAVGSDRGQADRGEAGDELVAARADVDGDDAGALEQRIGRAGHDEPAGVDHHDVVAHLLHVVEQVRGHQHRDAERAEAGDEREHLLAAERVEAGGRLVEQHQLGIADERLGELRALAHAGREPADRAEPGLVEPDEVEDVGRPLARRARRQPARARRTSTRRRPRSGRAAGSRARACSRAASARRSGSAATSMPHTSMRPSVGWASPSSRRNIVVLPAPFAPTRPTSPRGSSTVRSSSAVTPGYRLVRPSMRRRELGSVTPEAGSEDRCG